MSTQILRVVYISRATYPIDRDELVDMTLEFSKRNSRIGLTGTLVRIGNYFVQVLEGPAELVDELYAKIRLDSRHEGMTILARYLDDARLFSDWGMKFADLDARYYVNLAATAELRSHVEDFLKQSPFKTKAMLETLGKIQQHIRSATAIEPAQANV